MSCFYRKLFYKFKLIDKLKKASTAPYTSSKVLGIKWSLYGDAQTYAGIWIPAIVGLLGKDIELSIGSTIAEICL